VSDCETFNFLTAVWAVDPSLLSCYSIAIEIIEDVSEECHLWGEALSFFGGKHSAPLCLITKMANVSGNVLNT